MRGLVRTLVVLSAVLLVPASSFAQQASIAGVVKDASGAVLPGVSVEATSSALTEKVRAVVTDGTGQYRIVELPPGTYTLTFTLQGFNVVKREGIVLTGALTASIDVELRVGELQETVTVTGESPIVDVQSARRQQVIDGDVLQTHPDVALVQQRASARARRRRRRRPGAASSGDAAVHRAWRQARKTAA